MKPSKRKKRINRLLKQLVVLMSEDRQETPKHTQLQPGETRVAYAYTNQISGGCFYRCSEKEARGSFGRRYGWKIEATPVDGRRA